MRIIRVAYDKTSFYARLEGGQAFCLDRSKGLDGPLSLDQVRLLPLAVPTKIVCLAVNYRAHAKEIGHTVPDEPRIFLKPPSAMSRSGDPIVLPHGVGRVDFEGELAIVMGRQAKNIALDQVPGHVFGYACANDVTARALQERDGLFARAKGFDTFCPLGPWIETDVPNPGRLTVTTLVNGQVRQQGSTSDMVFGPLEVISFISRVMTLMPGDLILTGTPPGVGELHPGDEVCVDIEGVGRLINPVRAEDPGASCAGGKAPAPAQNGPVQ